MAVEQSESLEQAADEKTAAVDRQIKVLDEILTSALVVPPVSFERLMASSRVTRFDPGPLSSGLAEPAWAAFAPAGPRGLSRLFGGGTRYRRELAAARARFESAQSEFGRSESGRRQTIATAKARYDRAVTQERARVARHNADIAARQSAFASGAAESVEWYVGRVLGASRYPDVFPREHQVAYRPDRRDVVLEFELPPPGIVPSVRGFRYVRMRDVIEPVSRPGSEIRQRYERLICCIALRTLHEVFIATPPEVVASVVFNGRVATTDRATGKPVRPHLLSVSAERAVFGDLVLAAVEPAACLLHLNAVVSPDPFNLAAVEPLVLPGVISYQASSRSALSSRSISLCKASR